MCGFQWYFDLILVVNNEPKYDSRERVEGAGMVRGRHQAGQIMLESLTQRRVEGQVGPNDVLFDPHVRPQPLDLLPETIKVLLLRVRMIGFEYSERVVVNLLPALDVSLQAAQHPVQLTLLLLVQLPPYPGQGRQHAVGEPVPAHLGHTLLQGSVHEVVEQLQQGGGGYNVAVHKVRHKPEQKPRVRPTETFQTVLKQYLVFIYCICTVSLPH